MLTQWNRQELALAIKASLEYTIENADDLDEDTHKAMEPFLGMQLSHDTFHSNVVYMRLDDGSSYRLTLIQTQPPMPPAAGERSREREMAGTAGGEAGSGRRRRGDRSGNDGSEKKEGAAT